jgi:hypothetical protein
MLTSNGICNCNANLLNAMAALHIMQTAQWGPEVYNIFHNNRFSPFELIKYPIYNSNELYMPSIDESRSLNAALYFDR